MKFGKATLDILARLEVQTAASSPTGHTLKQILHDVPDDVEFSVNSSRAGLQKLEGARIPKAPLEMEGWIEDVADEIYRVGVEIHKTCGCGCSEANHIYTAFLIYLIGYVDAELKPSLDVLAQALGARVNECFSMFERFRPSEN